MLFIFLIFSSSWADNPVSVPIYHPVYSFLDRMETLGIIDNIRDGIKPFDRGRISKLLLQVNSNREQLTGIDIDRLNNLLADFRFEIDRMTPYQLIPETSNWYSPLSSFNQFKSDFRRFLQRNQPEEENHVFVWEDSSNSFYFDFIQDFTYDRRDDDVHRTNNAQTFRFRGNIGERFAYSLEVTQMALNGDREYRLADPVMKGAWNQSPGGTTFFDRSGGELVYRSPIMDFRFAHQSTTWGYGEFGQLILSDNVEQYPYFSISKHWKWGSFTFMHGKLLSLASPDSIDRQPIYPEKWIAAHRFEFSPSSRISIGLSELIIYGNRSVEWAYLVPLNLYRATEHYLRDRDNEMIALDFETRLFRGGKIYGTVFIDELFTSKLFTDWFGNKHGFHFGMHLVDPFQFNNLSLRFEYAAIMPWVYTHKFSINRYIHDGRSLGFQSGPNSAVIYLNLQKQWHYRFMTGIKWSQVKHGDNYADENIGGDILLGRNILLGSQMEARQTRDFLEGILTTEKQLEFYSEWEVFNDLFLAFSIATLKTKMLTTTSELTTMHFGFKFDY